MPQGSRFSHERVLIVLLLAGMTLLGGAMGYALGYFHGVSAPRLAEAVHDLSIPAIEAREERTRRAGIRRTTRRLASVQAEAFTETGVFVDLEETRLDNGWAVRVYTGWYTPGTFDYRGERYWAATVRDQDSPPGEFCAVAVNRDALYFAGVRLRRTERVRCSWDLANWLNTR